ncbi:MAG: hypothetical protein ACRC6P_21135 [Shewanella oncorhynchi]
MANNTKRAWSWAQRQASFTREELAAALGLTLKQCSTIIKTLNRREYITFSDYHMESTPRKGALSKRYKAVANKQYIERGMKTDQQLIWQSMRILRSFNYPELVSTTGINVGQIRTYCSLLMRFGYVRLVVAVPNHLPPKERIGQYATYRLIKDTGPIAPKRLGCHVLYDGNLNQEIQHDVA